MTDRLMSDGEVQFAVAALTAYMVRCGANEQGPLVTDLRAASAALTADPLPELEPHILNVEGALEDYCLQGTILTVDLTDDVTVSVGVVLTNLIDALTEKSVMRDA